MMHINMCLSCVLKKYMLFTLTCTSGLPAPKRSKNDLFSAVKYCDKISEESCFV